MAITPINPAKEFRGGANIVPDPDSGDELGDLIYELQVAHNTNETAIAAIAAEEVISVVLALPLQTLNHEHSDALDGTATKAFVPRFIEVVCRTATLAGDLPNGDAQITVGTAPGGAQLLSATPLTGMNVVGETFVIPLSGIFPSIAGNATLYAKVTTADTKGGGCAITADVTVSGKQV